MISKERWSLHRRTLLTGLVGLGAAAVIEGNKAVAAVEQNTLKRRGIGLVACELERASSGFTLFAPHFVESRTVYLIDLQGRVVHTWNMPYPPGLSGYLTERGTLFYNGRTPEESFLSRFPFKGGVVLEVDWNGKMLWELRHPDHHHHGILLRNGNVLLHCMGQVPEEIARRVRGGMVENNMQSGQYAARPEADAEKMYSDYLAELTPSGQTVWEWRTWEHLDPVADGIAEVQAPLGENAGGFLGPLVTLWLLYLLNGELRVIFYAALLPALAGVLIVMVVHERPPQAEKKIDHLESRALPTPYWKLLAVTAVFSIGNSSNSFLILRTQELGASTISITIIYASFNLIAALASYPLSRLSDMLGRRIPLIGSFVIFAIVYSGFYLLRSLPASIALFALYGVHQGVFRSIGKTYASDLAPEHLRATGIGWYHATVGLLQLFSSLLAGVLWDKMGHSSVFLLGLASAVAGIAAAILFLPSETDPAAARS